METFIIYLCNAVVMCSIPCCLYVMWACKNEDSGFAFREYCIALVLCSIVFLDFCQVQEWIDEQQLSLLRRITGRFPLALGMIVFFLDTVSSKQKGRRLERE